MARKEHLLGAVWNPASLLSIWLVRGTRAVSSIQLTSSSPAWNIHICSSMNNVCLGKLPKQVSHRLHSPWLVPCKENTPNCQIQMIDSLATFSARLFWSRGLHSRKEHCSSFSSRIWRGVYKQISLEFTTSVNGATIVAPNTEASPSLTFDLPSLFTDSWHQQVLKHTGA